MAKDNEIGKMSYEQAFSELEKLVAELEAEVHDLEASIALFERGQALAKHCAALLDQAELKVQSLSGSGELEDFQ